MWTLKAFQKHITFSQRKCIKYNDNSNDCNLTMAITYIVITMY